MIAFIKFFLLCCLVREIAAFSTSIGSSRLLKPRLFMAGPPSKQPLSSSRRDSGSGGASGGRSTGPTGMVRVPQKRGDELPKTRTKLSLREVFTPPFADGYSIALTLAGQGLLVNLAFMVSVVYGFFDSRAIGADYFSFDTNSMTMAAMFAVPLITAGFLLDQLPFAPFREIARDTRIFVLRLLGLNSPWLSTALIALLLSCKFTSIPQWNMQYISICVLSFCYICSLTGTAGFAEELAFRGILMRALDNASFFPVGLVASSALFGLAHFPVFGASAGVEAVLGGVFGYAYWLSGYNIAVPIALHTMYDFATISKLSRGFE